MATNHQSWYISTLKNSSFKHHVYYTYSSHNTHMIHKSLSTTLNLHKASLHIVIYIIVSFQYYPRFNSQGHVRNRSQTKETWQSVTAQLAMASSIARLASDYRSLAMASWIARLAKRYGSLAMASWAARLASDEGMLAVASYDSRLANGDRTGYGITNFFTKNPNFHPWLTPNSTETLALRLF